MAKRKKALEFYFYDCTLTGEKFKVTKEAPNPGELVCLNSFYEINPDLDDRPEEIKLAAQKKAAPAQISGTWEELVALAKPATPAAPNENKNSENKQ